MDGTFSTAPRQFHQLYVIRAPLQSEPAATCVYALLPGKTQAQYEAVLTAVLEKCEQLGHGADPSVVICDFDQAAINSVTSTIGQHVNVHGCLCMKTTSHIKRQRKLPIRVYPNLCQLVKISATVSITSA
jgi:hypothetical protein